ncbi:hypothetical protein GCM10011418_46650 [Sphingobacterium alkalisoli]|nr:hypothetical protein GCM10011418_46650 [Sphingobacterium alkalisoli]
MQLALTGDYPDYALNYSKVWISDGFFLAGGAPAALVDAGNLEATWDPTLSSMYDT